jgi:hypothetical protein
MKKSKVDIFLCHYLFKRNILERIHNFFLSEADSKSVKWKAVILVLTFLNMIAIYF